jgi:hypothetical protein
LNPDLWDDFLIGDDGKVREVSFDKFAGEAADIDSGKEDGGLASGRGGDDDPTHCMEDELDGIGVKGEVGTGRGLFDGAADHILDFRVEKVDREDGLS